jgi:DNA-binding transcriptional ArsR family regulator
MKDRTSANSLATTLASLSDPARLRMLRLLELHELSVGEIAKVFQVAQSTASRQLKVLSDAAWLAKRSEGTASYYKLVTSDLTASSKAIWESLRPQVGAIAGHEEDDRRVRGVLEERKTDEAIKLFDAAAEVAPTPVIGDAASLKSAFALMDTAPYADLEKRLKPLTETKRPYRATALEALAIAKLAAGKVDEAKSDFGVINLLPDAPAAMRERANAAISLIDSGSAGVMAEAVKLASSAKPNQLPESVILQPNGSISPSPSAEAPQ